MKTESTEKETGIADAFICVSICGVLLSVAGFATGGVHASFSVAAGAVIALLNLWGLSRLVRVYLYSGGLAWGLTGLLKMLVLFGGVFVLASRGYVDIVALIVGYGALPAGIVATRLKPVPPPAVEER